MTELQWNLGWTLATLGLCGLALSCVVALAVGQLIKRGKASTALEEAAPGAAPVTNEGATSFEFAERAELEHDYGSRTASGTHLKAIRLERDQPQTNRKVS
jgi:hypothetical protein